MTDLYRAINCIKIKMNVEAAHKDKHKTKMKIKGEKYAEGWNINDTKFIYSVSVFTIFALSAGYLLTKINIGKTGEGGFWLPVFPILIFLKLGTSG